MAPSSTDARLALDDRRLPRVRLRRLDDGRDRHAGHGQRRRRDAGRPHPGGRARPRGLRRPRRLRRRPGRRGRRLRRRRHRRLGLRAGDARRAGAPTGVRALSEDLAAGRARHDRLAAIPSPTQGVWELGPLPIRAYALCIVAGIVAAVLITEKRWVARGGAPGDVLDIAVWAVPFGIVGGRLYHVISSPRAYFGEGGDPMRAFAIWEGGLGIWGAIALGGVGAWIACRRRGIPLPAFADALAPGLLVAQAIGRLGNWFNNELYGGPTDLPWALKIYEWDGGRAAARRRQPADRARLLPPDVPLRAAVEPGRGRVRRSGPTAGSGSATAGPSRCTSPATAPGGCGSSCCAPTPPSTSSACGSTCSPRSSSACWPWPTSSAQRGRPREVIDRGTPKAAAAPTDGPRSGRTAPESP